MRIRIIAAAVLTVVLSISTVRSCEKESFVLKPGVYNENNY